MRTIFQPLTTLFLLIGMLMGCADETGENSIINDSRLVNAHKTPEEWLSYGRDYYEARHSPLDQVNKSTVDSLGLSWYINLGTKRGIEATPIVANGIMYFTGPWSKVYAVDLRKREVIWEYDPEVPKEWGEKVCCDVVNRGVAIYNGLVIFGTLDGRLMALEDDSGKLVWEVTTVDQSKPYSITGAPRIVKGKVIIGNGGADLGVRGYVTAYDAGTGKEEWRFFTVPGNPEDGFENDAMKKAAGTWTGEWWKFGGGGTAWDAFAYDPELNLLYVGTGNGSPWNRDRRSPGGGDNLYLSSILALNPDNGEMQWYYQTTPGDTWDYTATQHIILADIVIDDKPRKVLMQAPKNGFFYVLDRTNGELISADNYVYANWAERVDLTTGRPIETEYARYPDINALIAPGARGGHNWQPMAFNPTTGLVYIPAREDALWYGQEANWSFANDSRSWNTGIESNPDNENKLDSAANNFYGKLIAWDPVEQKEVWHVKEESAWNSGVLSTGDLVFKGNGQGFFSAYDAQNGEEVWSYDLKSGIIASPISYEIDGVQYISILVGWGGVVGLHINYTEQNNPGTLYTFALGENNPFPDFPKIPEKQLIDLDYDASEEKIANGSRLYDRYCSKCHGGGTIPDLKYSSEAVFNSFHNIVGEGAYLSLGMPSFENRLNVEEIEDIRNYILSEAKVIRESLNP